METQLLTMASETSSIGMTGFLMWYMIRQEKKWEEREDKWEAREKNLRNRYDSVIADFTKKVDGLNIQIFELIRQLGKSENEKNVTR